MEKYEWGYRKDEKSEVLYLPMHDCDFKGAKKFIELRRQQLAQYEPKATAGLFVRLDGQMHEIFFN